MHVLMNALVVAYQSKIALSFANRPAKIRELSQLSGTAAGNTLKLCRPKDRFERRKLVMCWTSSLENAHIVGKRVYIQSLFTTSERQVFGTGHPPEIGQLQLLPDRLGLCLLGCPCLAWSWNNTATNWHLHQKTAILFSMQDSQLTRTSITISAWTILPCKTVKTQGCLAWQRKSRSV